MAKTPTRKATTGTKILKRTKSRPQPRAKSRRKTSTKVKRVALQTDLPAIRGSEDRPALGFAMVGHAFMGRAHANAMRQVNRFFDLPYQVVPRVVVGREMERVEAARDKLGFAEASVDFAAVLEREDIHVVDVATPNDLHTEFAIAALKAGKHVMCEKPLALNLKDALAMERAAVKSGKRAAVWHNYRRSPATALAQRMIARGDLGKIRAVRAVYLQDWLADPAALASWRTDKEVCGSGAHGDLNAHLIDLTRALTGLEFAEVCAMEQTFTKKRKTATGKDSAVTVDDDFSFLARFHGNAIGTFQASRVSRGHKNKNCIEVDGERGTLIWDLERMNELSFFSVTDGEDVQGFRRIMCMDEKHPYAANWWPDGHIIGYEHTFVHHLADFVAGLKSKKRFRPDFADGVAVQAVLEAASKSATNRRWMTVPETGANR